VRVKERRLARGWSQAQLAEKSGLSVRTIQRIETGANPGLETLTRLAAVLDVDVAELQQQLADDAGRMSLIEAVSSSLRLYDEFSGTTGRVEFWWFTLAVALAVALGASIGPWLGTAVGVVALLPWLAAATRRLRDAGQSPWWLLIVFAPIGGLVVIAILLAMPTIAAAGARKAQTAESGRS
jgi:transcriptional regulator with XRE-family HTH domain